VSEWVITRLLFPFAPFAFDLLVRCLFFWGTRAWWQLPDVKTLAITTAFFCLLLALDLKGIKALPSDKEYDQALASIKKRFALQGILAAIMFGALTMLDATDQFVANAKLASVAMPSLLSVLILQTFISIVDAIWANLRYKLSYA